jgi:predicted  nucleic acid-binding Zn-ribbon protein
MITIGCPTIGKSLSGITLTAVVAALVAAVSSLPVVTSSHAAAADPRADKLLVVDCLLPGQVRRLGSTRTYLTPRRPAKTSASECEIRGGEYVSYDRANYATSLQIWLPQAKEGEPEAQTYVGEIFEKGLGTESDYQAAATWYRRAAEQGFTRAQINLGQLYEQGLGVPQDMREALNWYRRASGLEDDELQFASSVRVTMEAKDQEINQLREQTQRSEQEVAELQGQLEQAQKELESRQQQLAGTRDKLDEIQRQLKQQEDAIKSSTEAGMEQKQQELDEQESRLKAQRAQLSELESALAGQGAELTDEQRQAAEQNNRLQSKLVQQNAEAERLRSRMEQVERELSESRATLDSDSSKDAALIAQLQAAEAERASLEQELADRRGQIEELRGDLGTVKETLDQSAVEYAKAVNDLEQRKALFEVELQRVKAERDRLATKSEEDVERIKQLRAELKHQESEYKQKLEALEQDYAQSREQLERAKSEVAAVDGGGVDVASANPPAIELIEPPVMLTRSGNYTATIGRHIETRNVIGRVSAPAGVKLFNVNEQPTSVDDNGLFNIQVPVTDDRTPVSLVVVDKAGQRVTLDFDLFRRLEEEGSSQAAEPEGEEKSEFPHITGLGDYYALVIGNSQYEDFPSLRTPAKDAQAVADLLENEYGYKTQLILDANRYQIISALNDFRAKLTKDDNLLVYYAGHGEIDTVNDNGYWLPVDAEKDNTANWISTRSISEILNVMNAKHVMIVADSCYSGAMTRSALARLQSGKTVEEWVDWFKKVSKLRTRMVLSSGGEEPVNDGGGGEHSLFARAFINVLKENDRVLDGYNLYLAVSNLVKESIESQNLVVEQTPQYAPIKFAGHEAGEFVFQPI